MSEADLLERAELAGISTEDGRTFYKENYHKIVPLLRRFNKVLAMLMSSGMTAMSDEGTAGPLGQVALFTGYKSVSNARKRAMAGYAAAMAFVERHKNSLDPRHQWTHSDVFDAWTIRCIRRSLYADFSYFVMVDEDGKLRPTYPPTDVVGAPVMDTMDQLDDQQALQRAITNFTPLATPLPNHIPASMFQVKRSDSIHRGKMHADLAKLVKEHKGKKTTREYLDRLTEVLNRGGVFVPVFVKHPDNMGPAQNNDDTAVWPATNFAEGIGKAKTTDDISDEALASLLMTTGTDKDDMATFVDRHIGLDSPLLLEDIVSKATELTKSKLVVLEGETSPFVLPIDYVNDANKRAELKQCLEKLDGKDVMNDDSALSLLATMAEPPSDENSRKSDIVTSAIKLAKRQQRRRSSSNSNSQVEFNENEHLQEGAFSKNYRTKHIAFAPFTHDEAHTQLASSIAELMSWFEEDDVFATLQDSKVFEHISMCTIISGNVPMAYIFNLCLLFIPEDNPYHYSIPQCPPSACVSRPMANGMLDNPEVLQWNAADRSGLLRVVWKMLNMDTPLEDRETWCYEMFFKAAHPMTKEFIGEVARGSPFRPPEPSVQNPLSTRFMNALQWHMQNILTTYTCNNRQSIECSNIRIRIGRKGDRITRHMDSKGGRMSYGKSLLILCLKGRYTMAIESKFRPGQIAYIDMRPGRSYMIDSKLFHQQQGTTESTTISVIWALSNALEDFVGTDEDQDDGFM
jgi:hypothetical protein